MRTFKRPNVLVIYTDQQRCDSLGCYGSQHAITPNLDRLAAEGARLDNYFVQNPVCMPSRMSFLTGKYCSTLGIGTNGISLPENEITINKILRTYGYNTAQIGKLHFQPHAKRDHRDPHPEYGFDTFILSDEPGCYDDAYIKWVEAIDPDMVSKVRTSLPPAAYHYGKESFSDIGRDTHEPYLFEGDEGLTHSSFVASEVSNFISRSGENPFFVIAGFYAPHTPVNPPKKYVDMYKGKDIPLPKVGKNEDITPILRDITPEKWKEIITYYLALVTHVDDCVGKILDALKQSGKEENTIIIFTTDHGEYLGDHGRIQKGMPGHDCIVNVPFLMKYPGKVTAGLEINAMIEAVDIVPTILDYCAIQTPQFVQGKSIRPVLEGKVQDHKEDVLIEFFSPYGLKETTVRNQRYKYYYSSDGQEILYDLAKDPDELNNVMYDSSYDKVLGEMRARMIKRLQLAAYRNLEKSAEY